MENFLPLGNVFENVIGLVEATAKHLEAVAGYESSRGDRTREALLARTVAKERNELAAGLGDYLARAPQSVKSTWLQYTSEADANELLEQLKRTRDVSEAVRSLDVIDQTVSEVFALSGRQEQPDEAKRACEWAVQKLQRERERRASAVRTSNDV